MIDRREFIGGGVAFGATAPAFARGRTEIGRVIDVGRPAGFSGAVLFARGGRTEVVQTFGYADWSARTPVTRATRFAFGSGSKWLTSVAVLKLVEAGRLGLDRPVTAYLPDFRRDTGERVTVRHLLSNTSGVPDLLARAMRDEPGLRTARYGAAAVVALFAGGDLAFQPGDKFDYAALNWVVVNAIVERVTGEPFPNAMRNLVFKPLGLGTLALASDGWAAVPGMARAYASVSPPVAKMAPVPAFVAASGNFVGTAHDAMRAAHGVFATGFLRPASRAALTEIRWPAEGYALGGRVRAIGGERWAWETGKVQGYRALIAQNLARDETIVVFNNTDTDQSVIATWAERIATAAR